MIDGGSAAQHRSTGLPPSCGAAGRRPAAAANRPAPSNHPPNLLALSLTAPAAARRAVRACGRRLRAAGPHAGGEWLVQIECSVRRQGRGTCCEAVTSLDRGFQPALGTYKCFRPLLPAERAAAGGCIRRHAFRPADGARCSWGGGGCKQRGGADEQHRGSGGAGEANRWLACWLACLLRVGCIELPCTSTQVLLSTTCPLTLCLPAQAAAVLPLPPTSTPLQFSRLHADMQEESRHDRAALQQLASSLAAPASIPLLK